MSILQEVNALPMSPKDLKKFGLTVGIVFGVLGAFLMWRGRAAGVVFLPLGVGLLFFGLIAPKLLKFVYVFWMTMAIALGWVMTHMILFIMFYFVMTPIAWILRARGKDILNIRFGPGEGSHWVVRRARDKKSYTQQF